jgi:hypothetical protein
MHATRTTPLRERMRQELQLAGLSERTQEAYLRAVRQLATHFGRPPDQISEPELRQYLLFLKNEKHFAPASLKIAFYAIRFFFRTTLPRAWPTLRQLRIPKQKTLLNSTSPLRSTERCWEPLPKRAPPARAKRQSRGEVVGPASGPLEQRIAGPAARPAIHILLGRARWGRIASPCKRRRGKLRSASLGVAPVPPFHRGTYTVHHLARFNV